MPADFGRGVIPELQVQVLEATLSHVRPVTAIMEAIGVLFERCPSAVFFTVE